MFLDLGIEYYIETHKVPWNPEALHVEPILNPPPTSLPIPSLCVRGEGECVMALESRQGTRASRRVEEVVWKGFPAFPAHLRMRPVPPGSQASSRGEVKIQSNWFFQVYIYLYHLNNHSPP